jgi:hypothetical protein
MEFYSIIPRQLKGNQPEKLCDRKLVRAHKLSSQLSSPLEKIEDRQIQHNKYIQALPQLLVKSVSTFIAPHAST